MTDTSPRLGTLSWVTSTGGRLTAADRRGLLRPIAVAHAANLAGRAAMLLHLNSGRRAEVGPSALLPPVSALTAAAEREARRRLSPALLNHSHRSYAFASALATLAGLDVDRELLFAAAMLHDTGLMTGTGLVTPAGRVDFTVASDRIARDVAEDVGLSTAATETMRTAITLHHTPGVSLADGPVAYLLSAGAGVDVTGLRAGKLPARTVAAIVAEHPRLGFTREFTALVRAEAAAVPAGRVQLLRRYGAYGLAVRLAPFRA